MIEKHCLKINGTLVLKLNSTMIEKRGLSEEGVQLLLKLHEKRWKKIELMKTLDPTDRSALHSLRNQITEIDFELQRTWGFEVNKNFHRFFDLPHCTCPKMDNEQRLGTNYLVLDGSCPVHT